MWLNITSFVCFKGKYLHGALHAKHEVQHMRKAYHMKRAKVTFFTVHERHLQIIFDVQYRALVKKCCNVRMLSKIMT